MKWTKTPHDDDSGHYWRSECPGICAIVELAPWLNAERPWAASVIAGSNCEPVSHSKTPSEAKAKVRKHLLATAKRLTAWGAE